MTAYFEHPGLLFGLLWAFWLCVAFGVSVLCIPLSFLSKCSTYTYRISRAVLCGTIPLVIVFLVSLHFDPSDDLAVLVGIGIIASCLPAVPSLIAFFISHKASAPTMNDSKTWKTAAIILSSALVACIGLVAYLLLQNFWWKCSVDRLADQAGAAQAMSSFRRGRLVLWEVSPTNNSLRFSGRHDGPFEVWLDEYQPEMPSAWQYSRQHLNKAHNAQMRYMYQHPQKFTADIQSGQDGSKESRSDAEATTERFATALARFDVVPMVEELHPDFHQVCYQLAVHIAETTKPESEQKELLKSLGVDSLDALKKLTPKAATEKFYQSAFSYAPAPAKKASLESKIKIVGSLVEGEMVHVLYRSEADVPELGMSLRVPSVVTLKRFDGKLKVVSTTQFESSMAKLEGGGK